MIAAAHTHESVRAAIDDSDRFLIQQVFRPIGSFRDKYVLEPGEALEGVDRRLVLAFAVALDALQDR